MKWAGIAVAAAVAVLAGAAGVWFIPDGGGADRNNTEQVALGARLYAENCAACHGANLEGQADWKSRKADGRLPAPPHDDTGHSWHHPDHVLFEITKNGIANYAPPGYESDMAAFGEVLRDDEIWAVLAYIKTHWSAASLQRQMMLSQRPSD